MPLAEHRQLGSVQARQGPQLRRTEGAAVLVDHVKAATAGAEEPPGISGYLRPQRLGLPPHCPGQRRASMALAASRRQVLLGRRHPAHGQRDPAGQQLGQRQLRRTQARQLPHALAGGTQQSPIGRADLEGRPELS